MTKELENTPKRKKIRENLFFIRNPHVKFQDFYMHGSRDIGGIKSLIDEHRQSERNMPLQLCQSCGGHKQTSCYAFFTLTANQGLYISGLCCYSWFEQ